MSSFQPSGLCLEQLQCLGTASVSHLGDPGLQQLHPIFQFPCQASGQFITIYTDVLWLSWAIIGCSSSSRERGMIHFKRWLNWKVQKLVLRGLYFLWLLKATKLNTHTHTHTHSLSLSLSLSPSLRWEGSLLDSRHFNISDAKFSKLYENRDWNDAFLLWNRKGKQIGLISYLSRQINKAFSYSADYFAEENRTTPYQNTLEHKSWWIAGTPALH